jgi:hypothetical protein
VSTQTRLTTPRRSASDVAAIIDAVYATRVLSTNLRISAPTKSILEESLGYFRIFSEYRSGYGTDLVISAEFRSNIKTRRR